MERWGQHKKMLEKSGIKMFNEFYNFLEYRYKNGYLYSKPNIKNDEDDITDDINSMMSIISEAFQSKDKYKLVYIGSFTENYNYGHVKLFQHFEKRFFDKTIKKINRVFSQKERNRGKSGIYKSNLTDLIDNGTLEIINESSKYKIELSSFSVTLKELQDFNLDIKNEKYNNLDNYDLELLKKFESTNNIEPLKKRVRSILGSIGGLNWCNTNVYNDGTRSFRKLPYIYGLDSNF